ncbi:MAG: DUF1565 domain-containing protein [Deltaproteobacteria bacterium]|nr:DUF1565 domain-containing protein [Deltaproteobacteria bacterium]
MTTLLVACSDQHETIPSGGGGGQGGSDAGGADSGCEPGHKPLDDGECQPAGVPPEMCGAGFAADDAGGCAAILPSAPCESGTMALPGETECRPIAPCGSGRWGDIPIQGEANAQFVDQSYAGGDSDGSEQKPWTTIAEGIAAAEPDALVAVAEGTYAEMVHVEQHAVRLWGRCPSLVQLEGDPYGIVVGWDVPLSDTVGTEIHNLGLTAVSDILVVSNTMDLLVDQVWVHDSGEAGMIMAPAWGPSSARVSRSLFEHTGGLGISAASSSLEVSETVIRDIVDGPLGEGRGIAAERISEGPLTFTLESSVIERATGIGLAIAGIEATIDASVVVDTRPAQPDLTLGRGMTIQDSPAPDHARADVAIRQSVVDTQHDVGIFINGSDALIEHTVVRNTAPNAANDETGMGIVVQYTVATDEVPDVVIRESLVEHSHDTGIGVASATGRLESVIVRDTQPRQSDGFRGIGVIVSYDITGGPGSSPPSTATVRWSLIEHNHVIGISIFGSTATVDASAVQHTAPMADGRFGDGLLVLGDLIDPAQLDLTASLVGENQRAGVVSFGATVRMGTSQVRCNAIDLDGEQWVTTYSFEDLGDNQCGCEEDEVCHVMSSNLEAPVGLTD